MRVLLIGISLVIGLAAIGCSTESPPQSPVVAVQTAEPLNFATGEVAFVQGYQAGCKLAGETGKPMLIYFTASWCDHCQQMAADAFVQPAVVSLSERFLCVQVDADREAEVCRQFQVKYYPTLQFLSPRGAPLSRLTGKQPAPQLLSEMHSALQSIARRPVGSRF